MNNYDTLEDGTVVFDSPIELKNRFWRQITPASFAPVFRPCTKRKIELRVLDCGRQRADYHCDKFDKFVSQSICEDCNASE